MSRVSSELLLDLHGCAGDPLRWQRLLDGMCVTLQVRSAVAQIFERDGFRMRQRWAARDSFSAMHAKRHDALVNNDDNPRTDLRIVTRFGKDVILRDRDIFPVNCPHLERLESRLAAIGLGQSVAINLPISDDVSFSLVLHRSRDNANPFALDDEAVLRELVPHLQQMLKFSIAREASLDRLRACEEAADNLHTGVLVFDLRRKLIWMSEPARQIVEHSPYLNVRDGVLRCAAPADEQKLRGLIAGSWRDAALPARRAVIALGATDRHAVQIATVAPNAREHGANPWFGTPERIGLLLTEPGRPPALSAQEVARLFDLSPAEAALAAALCTGQSVSDYAGSRGISVGTARIQLKRILSKTNTRRQSDLVRLICASVAAQTGAATH